MVKQVQIFTAATIEKLQQHINEFCVDFFPEEIADITIKEITAVTQDDYKWLGYIVYNKNEY